MSYNITENLSRDDLGFVHECHIQSVYITAKYKNI